MTKNEIAPRRKRSHAACCVRRLMLAVTHAASILVLASCASDERQKSDRTANRYSERMEKQIKDPHSIKSPFQKDVFHASETVKTSGYKTGEFSGKKKGFFGRKERFKAG